MRRATLVSVSRTEGTRDDDDDRVAMEYGYDTDTDTDTDIPRRTWKRRYTNSKLATWTKQPLQEETSLRYVLASVRPSVRPFACRLPKDNRHPDLTSNRNLWGRD